MKRLTTVLRQSTPWTCGPCCALMAQNAFGEDITKSQETPVWNQTITHEEFYPYTTHPRLASYLMRQGYATELWHEYPEGFRQGDGMSAGDFTHRMHYYDKYRAVAEQHGMRTKIKGFGAPDVAAAVTDPDTVAIVFTNIGRGETFHHILVYDAIPQGVRIACPLQGLSDITIAELEQRMTIPHGKAALIVRRRK